MAPLKLCTGSGYLLLTLFYTLRYDRDGGYSWFMNTVSGDSEKRWPREVVRIKYTWGGDWRRRIENSELRLFF